MTACSPVVWACVAGGRKLIEGLELSLDGDDKNSDFKAKIIHREDNRANVQFSWNCARFKTFSDVLDLIGKTPLPPYMKRDSLETDKTRYQTVYAQYEGSVAAPTAGLHFTDNLVESLKINGVDFASLTLHVGLGTFKPIESKSAAEHSMHRELISIDKSNLVKITKHLEDKKKVTAIGTTSVRTLETLYWLGVKLIQNKIVDNKFELSQLEPYELSENFTKSMISAYEAYNALNLYCEKNNLSEISGETQLMIAPGYKFSICDAIVTNFHQPRSTLILLVAAFLGKNLWQNAYQNALDNDYRFLSYGDSSILL